jgi:benzil reductase ((S)-benzoin forming)
MKLTLITGGSRGLGKALVEKYKHQGFTVFEFSRSGKSENHVACDFSSPSDAGHMIDKMLADLSKQDYSEVVFINNAGTLDPIGPIAGFEVDACLQSIHINLNSAMISSGLFIKHFQNHSARKVMAGISSGAAIRVKPVGHCFVRQRQAWIIFLEPLPWNRHQRNTPLMWF